MNSPSIFNDVLGPVMRGPSSSHCAAALRIGRICRDLMNEDIRDVLIEFDPNGSLATTHKSQGSDMGLFGGFLGWEAHDERLPEYEEAIARSGMNIHIDIHDIGAGHPNTYLLTLSNTHDSHRVTALSTGGGMIEIIEIDGIDLSLFGDYYETLIYTRQDPELKNYFETLVKAEEILIHNGKTPIIEIKSREALSPEIIREIEDHDEVIKVRTIRPVLPVLSSRNALPPFLSASQMLDYNKDKELSLWELAIAYESVRGGMTDIEVYNKMKELVHIMRTSIQSGLRGTNYHDRILGSQSMNFQKGINQKTLLEGQVLNQIILYVSAMMEVKSSMGAIVAAPTAGACGALPGAILGACSALRLSDDQSIKAMLCAGIIGVFIAAHATFAAEVGGCQAECGSGSCMAAAGLTYLGGGSLDQSLAAASQALQNSLGMICDPVANRVEAPCLGKNVMAASNALSCTNMALADYDPLIPLDQVIGAMAEVSQKMAHELRCTGLGGLSITKASKEIEARLNPGEVKPVQEDLAQISRRFKLC